MFERRFAITILVEFRIDAPRNVELQRSSIRQRLRDRIQLLLTLGRQRRVTRRELNVAEVLLLAAATERGRQKRMAIAGVTAAQVYALV